VMAKSTDTFRILSFDGGGIRGVMSAVWLARLEDKLKDNAGKHVDLLAGTSTGSILACAVAVGIPAAKILDMYENRGREVFPATASRLWDRAWRTFQQGVSAPKYNDNGIREVLIDVFGDARLGDLPPSPVLIVPTYNTLTRQAVVIKSNSSEFKSLPLWEVAKASSAAPVYFPAHIARIHDADAPLIDGGVVANNPTNCAIAEGVKLCKNQSKATSLANFIVGSFGTGQATRQISIREAREWGGLEWVLPVIDVLMDGASDAVHYVSSQLLTKKNYIRLQTELSEAYDDMDNASKTNINALKSMAYRYLKDQRGEDELTDLVKLIA